MTRLAALALALAASPATAAPLTPWEPGASPCAGACSLEWALEQTGAPAGEMQPLTIPAGTPILWMSYARDGVPFGLDYHGRPTLRPLAAVGYPLGDGRWLVQIKECGNWAIVHLPGGAVAGLVSVLDAPATPLQPVRPDRARLTPPTGPLPPVVVVPPIVPPGVTPEPPEPPVQPVPLPAGIWLMLGALWVLGLLRRRRG